MTNRKKCDWVDCPRPANVATGNCDLHDAITMTNEAWDLLEEVIGVLEKVSRKDQEGAND